MMTLIYTNDDERDSMGSLSWVVCRVSCVVCEEVADDLAWSESHIMELVTQHFEQRDRI